MAHEILHSMTSNIASFFYHNDLPIKQDIILIHVIEFKELE